MAPITKRFCISSAALIVCAAFFWLFTTPRGALAQSAIGDFNITSLTTITVTVMLADGQVSIVPVVLNYTAENKGGYGFIELDTAVQQQPGKTITVEESDYIAATMRVAVQADPRTPVVGIVPTPVATIAPAVVVVAPTPVPTPLPRVEPTIASPTEQFTAEEIAFIAQVHELLGSYGQASDILRVQFSAMSSDPTVILTQDWIIKTATGLALMGSTNDSVNALSIPSRFTQAGFELKTAANLLDRAVTAYTTGIDERDANEISIGNQLVTAASAAISRAKGLLAIP